MHDRTRWGGRIAALVAAALALLLICRLLTLLRQAEVQT
jgi:hypothetical protein